MSPDLVLRPGTTGDLAAVAEVHLRARRAAVPAMPPPVHDDDAVRAHLARTDLTARDLWLAETGDRLVGYALLTPTWLDDLYVDPAHQGQGVGSALLDLARAVRPDGFDLWVFASNAPARAFYRRHGLVEVGSTDGSGNEEQEPDVRLRWAGPPAVPGLSAPRGELG
ncbi:GNAT family N-acetyltransferase [Nocardioides sp. AX2bis]|uniref:GNAT family N-acetyltransferase n=1 Tax=Nocardioides sp. AX2bis TaxID=2653157 RepID=UPI0012F020E8|nr:GNAT family N-acetyltransferase [Nocardioides sp. AX2bis]VXB71776.1 hypothetical protein NOCARDAX2BIS_320012 [Nocardioides sp. AX2bis]